jgi:uncharacterized repeat protein (TIGR03803 family)
MAHGQTPRTLIRFAVTLIAGALSVASALAGESTFETLLVFNGIGNGGQPWATPIVDKFGNLYGTTTSGGNGPCWARNLKLGCGIVYELSPPMSGTQWTETLLYQFQGGDDGDSPFGGLVFDDSGNLYGTTEYGGTPGYGTVFKLSPPPSGSGPWTEATIYNFPGGASGKFPVAGLIVDNSGNLYGTTWYGGTCSAPFCGVVFELSPPSGSGNRWTQTVLHTFQGPPDGAWPESTLVFANGKLYGTTTMGGTGNALDCDENCGAIFELSPPASPGGAWTETILHSFSATPTDGGLPWGGLVPGKDGIFYGATSGGGNFGWGTVYEFAPPASPGGSWTETILYSFQGCADGCEPYTAPVIGTDGSLYAAAQGVMLDQGNIFQLSPPAAAGDPWVETSLYSFINQNTFTGLVFGKDGRLYGGAYGGLDDNCGTLAGGGERHECGELFRISP